jgi:hypothetical protein
MELAKPAIAALDQARRAGVAGGEHLRGPRVATRGVFRAYTARCQQADRDDDGSNPTHGGWLALQRANRHRHLSQVSGTFRSAACNSRFHGYGRLTWR